MNKKIFTALVAIACTLVLATGCSVTPHEDVMKSDPAVEQTETTANDDDSKTVEEDVDKSDDQSDTDKKSNETADAETDKQSNSKSDSGSSNQNRNSGSANSSASKPSTGNSGSSTSGNSSGSNNSASKPSTGNSGSSNASKPSQPADTKPSQPAQDSKPSEPAKPAHTHKWVWATHTETTPEQSHVVETKKYVCNSCGQQFDDNTGILRHIAADFWDNCENYTYKVVDSHKVVDVPAQTVTVNDYEYCASCGEQK